MARGGEAARTRSLTALPVLQFAQLLLAPTGVAAALTILFAQWSATSVWSFPQFLISILLLVYAPGKLLIDFATFRLQPLEDLTLSLTLGMLVSSLLYWVTTFFGIPQAFFLWPLTAVAVLTYRRRGRRPELPPASLQARYLLLIGLIVLSLLPLTVLPMYYRSFSLSGRETMTFPRATPDLVLHTSIANELTHSIPPQVPFLAGSSLSYHYAMDLFVAMLSSTAGLSTLDLTARFVPTLFVALTILSIFTFSRVWLRSHHAALLTAFLVIFGEDFSFIPGLLLGPGP